MKTRNMYSQPLSTNTGIQLTLTDHLTAGEQSPNGDDRRRKWPSNWKQLSAVLLGSSSFMFSWLGFQQWDIEFFSVSKYASLLMSATILYCNFKHERKGKWNDLELQRIHICVKLSAYNTLYTLNSSGSQRTKKPGYYMM